MRGDVSVAHLRDLHHPGSNDPSLGNGPAPDVMTDDLRPDHLERLSALETELAQLKEAVASQRQIGVALGLVAHRYGCTLDQAWKLLTRVSQNTNIKVRDIAVVVTDSFNAEPATGGTYLPEEIGRFLPDFGGAG